MPGKTADVAPDRPLHLRASMRPQRNAGENRKQAGPCMERAKASMRPQRNAGENGWFPPASVPSTQGFNEAPAKCRGKHMRLRHLPGKPQRLQ